MEVHLEATGSVTGLDGLAFLRKDQARNGAEMTPPNPIGNGRTIWRSTVLRYLADSRSKLEVSKVKSSDEKGRG